MRMIQLLRAWRTVGNERLPGATDEIRRVENVSLPGQTGRAQCGTTLVELLASVIVLVLFGLIVNTGLNLVLSANNTITSEAEAELLLPTAGEAVSNELRYALDIGTAPNAAGKQELKDYTSGTFGEHCNITVDANGQLQVNEGKPLLPSHSYGDNSKYIVDLPGGILYDSSEGVFSFTLVVKEKTGENEETRAEADFAVSCLNFDAAGG